MFADYTRDMDSLRQLSLDIGSVKDSLTSTYPTKSKTSKTSSSKGGAMTADPHGLKRLEKKIEHLTKIGGRLQSENKGA